MNNEARKERWNKFVEQKNGFFLESWEWGIVQGKLGRQIWRLFYPQFQTLLISYQLPLGKSYLYAPRGPVTEEAQAVRGIHDLLHDLKENISKQIIFLRIEPALKESKVLADNLMRIGFHRSLSAQPETTQILDLKKTEAELFNAMQYETRYAVRVAKKRGVRIAVAKNLSEKRKAFKHFFRLFEETNKRHNLKAYPKNYYWEVLSLANGCESKIFSASLDGEIVSSAIIIYFGRRAVYLYSASAHGYGRFNAPTLLLWEAILESKSRGLDIFDFWGVSLENKKWAGITAFKKSFGGRELRYTGTWDYVFDGKWYFLYNLLKRFTQ